MEEREHRTKREKKALLIYNVFASLCDFISVCFLACEETSDGPVGAPCI